MVSECDLSFESITAKLKFTAPGKGERYDQESCLDVVSIDEYEKRKKRFWDIVKSKIVFPPEKIYYYQDYYSSDVMWGCSYIFLNDGYGLLLHIGASD